MGVTEGRWSYRRIQIPGWMYFPLLANSKKYDLEFKTTFLGKEEVAGPVFYEVLLSKAPINTQDQEFLGIPDCCRLSNELAHQKVRKEFLWEIAEATEGRQITHQIITLEDDLVMGAFWQQLLLNPVAYHYCSFQCSASKQLQNEQLDFLYEKGFKEEADTLSEIYAWPLEWSASHGIAELRTPVIKLAYDTDATGEKYSIRKLGERYPQHGAMGLHFPYRRRSFLKITDSKSFREGLKYGG